MSVEIRVTAGPAKGQRFTFTKPDNFLLGRTPEAHISLPADQYISRQHFFLHVAPPNCKLRDLGSTNGVIVNGVRYGGKTPAAPHIPQAPFNEVCLKDGDEIVVGETRINVSIHPIKAYDRHSSLVPESEKPIAQNDSSAAILQADAQESTPQQKNSIPDEMALLVIDLVQSTKHLLKMGDYHFSELIEQIRQRFHTHRSASDLLSLTCTGDGFLAAYRNVTKALSVASAFLRNPIDEDVHIRMAVHWGAAKIGQYGNVLGKEAQQVRQLEGLQEKDRIGTTLSLEALPEVNRVLITEPAFKRLKPSYRKKFIFAGTFPAEENSQEEYNLWVFQKPGAKKLL